MKHVLLIHGPNLNLLGKRETVVYGMTTLEQINNELNIRASKLGIELRIQQSNSEGEIVDAIHKAMGWAEALIINPGGYTHSSVAIRDAIAGSAIPTIEVHLSNIYAREEFRHHSFIAPVAKGQICGLGPASYYAALQAVAEGL